MKDGLSQIIINVEAQKNDPSEYHILNRTIFYVSRMISSQKERDFRHSNYNDIKQVYSIWVCMNMPENSLNHIHLIQRSADWFYDWKGNMNLINIVMIGLAKELPKHDETYTLHRLLHALLSKKLTVHEKINIFENEYHIPVEGTMRKDVDIMSNLSQGIREEERTEERTNIILTMLKNGFSVEQIARAIDMNIKDVAAIVAGKVPSNV